MLGIVTSRTEYNKIDRAKSLLRTRNRAIPRVFVSHIKRHDMRILVAMSDRFELLLPSGRQNNMGTLRKQ